MPGVYYDSYARARYGRTREGDDDNDKPRADVGRGCSRRARSPSWRRRSRSPNHDESEFDVRGRRDHRIRAPEPSSPRRDRSHERYHDRHRNGPGFNDRRVPNHPAERTPGYRPDRDETSDESPPADAQRRHQEHGRVYGNALPATQLHPHPHHSVTSSSPEFGHALHFAIKSRRTGAYRVPQNPYNSTVFGDARRQRTGNLDSETFMEGLAGPEQLARSLVDGSWNVAECMEYGANISRCSEILHDHDIAYAFPSKDGWRRDRDLNFQFYGMSSDDHFESCGGVEYQDIQEYFDELFGPDTHKASSMTGIAYTGKHRGVIIGDKRGRLWLVPGTSFGNDYNKIPKGEGWRYAIMIDLHEALPDDLPEGITVLRTVGYVYDKYTILEFTSKKMLQNKSMMRKFTCQFTEESCDELQRKVKEVDAMFSDQMKTRRPQLKPESQLPIGGLPETRQRRKLEMEEAANAVEQDADEPIDRVDTLLAQDGTATTDTRRPTPTGPRAQLPPVAGDPTAGTDTRLVGMTTPLYITRQRRPAQAAPPDPNRMPIGHGRETRGAGSTYSEQECTPHWSPQQPRAPAHTSAPRLQPYEPPRGPPRTHTPYPQSYQSLRGTTQTSTPQTQPTRPSGGETRARQLEPASSTANTNTDRLREQMMAVQSRHRRSDCEQARPRSH